MIHKKILMGILASVMVFASSQVKSQAAEASFDNSQELFFHEEGFVTNGEEFLTAANTASVEVLDSGVIYNTNITWTLYTDGRLILKGSGSISDGIKGCWNDHKNRITSIVVNNGITSIGSEAFIDCSNVTSIHLADTVTDIGESAFSGCSKLSDISLGKNTTTIRNLAFYGCASLKEIIIPEGTLHIPWMAFANCTSLQKITLPSSLSMIWQSAFENCTSLAQIDLPENMNDIKYNAFSGCTSLTSIRIPEKMQNLPNNLFYNCTSLTSVILPQVVNHIGSYCFYGCISLTDITLTDCVTHIEEYAFYKCSSLTSLTLQECTTAIGDYAFAYCTGLTSLRIPGFAWSFGDDIFYGCTNLKQLGISANVKGIGKDTLSRSYLEEIYFEGSEEAWKLLNLDPADYHYANVYYDYDPNHPQHTYGPWATVSAATVFSPEQQVRTCTVCQKEEYRSNGAALTPTVQLSTNRLVLKTNQTTNILKAAGFANGDYVRTWKSANTNVVRVFKRPDGACSVKSGSRTGKTRITLSLASGLTRSIYVTVQSQPVRTTKITGVPSHIMLKVLGVQTLHPVLTPLTSTERITYASSNAKVADVNTRGRILALKKGNATITVQSGSQILKCRVLVK